MRNDALDELDDDVPSLSTDARDREAFGHAPVVEDRFEPRRTGPARRGIASGFLWVLVLALIIALGGLGWWSYQQISLMEQQLVATQESFARISEEAAGRIRDISGKIVSAESTVTSGSEAVKLQVRQLGTQYADLAKQQQAFAARQDELGKRLDQLGADLQAQKGADGDVGDRLKALAADQDRLKAQQADLGKFSGRLDALDQDVAALKKQGNPSQAIKELQQDLLVLRSQLDDAPAAPASNAASTAEFDAFRAQVTRNINALQSQVQNLQQQLNAR
jgi:chromosome segregation ATPase